LHLHNKIAFSNITLTKDNFSNEFNIKPKEFDVTVDAPVELVVWGVGLAAGTSHVPDEPLTYT
jgi:hypothetical protein